MTGRGALRRVRALAARCGWSVLRTLVAYGSLWTHRPPDELWPRRPAGSRPPSADPAFGPPPGHPERLAAGAPPSAAERDLFRRLLGP